MLHIPILRWGEPYRSLETARAVHYRTREPFVEVSQANVGLVRRDMRRQEAARRVLAKFSVEELVAMCARAAEHFASDELMVGDSVQTPEDYVRQVTATTGMPHVLVRRNLEKIRGVLSTMGDVLAGLTRGLDLRVLDEGFGEQGGQVLSFYPVTQALGVVLPSNSPAVHALWTPAVALKTPLVLKPGASEPWTPYRLIEAFEHAGVPRGAFGYYPTDHAGAGVILEQTGRGMMFGDVSSVGAWKDDPRVELHGPGYSKIVIGEDCADEWEEHLDVIAASIADNGGRSCVNASGVWVTRHGAEIAEALAEKLSAIVPRAEDDPEAVLAPFADPSVAERINNMVEAAMREPGARDVTAARRGDDRIARREGCAYLLPTVVHCESPGHPLANREFLFPFASVVEVGPEEIPEALGPSLVVTAVTRDAGLVRRLAQSPLVGRLNVGAVATNLVRWDQPHEGNLFEHLYARRAFHRAAAG
ncbi:MAG TPA: aldehyde dehydrogenase family protein [Pyrinomonadaceae bacterium]